VQDFELLGELSDIETIAVGRRIRDLPRLRRLYGKGRWRKMKGIARIRLKNGREHVAELHWYEAHGIGRKEIKRKRNLD
jgi:nucleotidyltransferase/DNA polymerase involved in DNA repair